MSAAIFIDEQRKARKPHICSSCGKTIEQGTQYRYIKGVGKKKNDFYLKYICKECNK